jgi:hypothetical protein
MLPRSAETEALVRATAASTGKSLDQVVVDALRKSEASAPSGARKPDVAAMRKIARRVSAIPLRDSLDQKTITDEGWGS